MKTKNIHLSIDVDVLDPKIFPCTGTSVKKGITMEKLEEFIELFYRKLRKGGTCIIFFDLWKLTSLKIAMEKYKFKQIKWFMDCYKLLG